VPLLLKKKNCLSRDDAMEEGYSFSKTQTSYYLREG